MKVGDKVIVSTQRGYRLSTIDRETPTMWVVGANKFRKSDLYLVGAGTWNYIRCIAPYEGEAKIRYDAFALQERRNRMWRRINKATETLEANPNVSLEDLTRIAYLLENYAVDKS